MSQPPEIRVVVFTENNARILINPPNLSYWKSCKHAVVDPDLSKVRGVPPHLWVLKDGEITRMASPDARGRLDHIKTRGAVNEYIEGPELPAIRALSGYPIAVKHTSTFQRVLSKIKNLF